MVALDFLLMAAMIYLTAGVITTMAETMSKPPQEEMQLRRVLYVILLWPMVLEK